MRVRVDVAGSSTFFGARGTSELPAPKEEMPPRNHGSQGYARTAAWKGIAGTLA